MTCQNSHRVSSKQERVWKDRQHKPYAEVKDEATLAVSSLGQTIPALKSLRNWGLATIAGQVGFREIDSQTYSIITNKAHYELPRTTALSSAR